MALAWRLVPVRRSGETVRVGRSGTTHLPPPSLAVGEYLKNAPVWTYGVALAGRIAAEEFAPAAVQPFGRLEQALHVFARGRVLQGGLEGPELLDDVLEGVGRRLRLQPRRIRPPAVDGHGGQRDCRDRGGGPPP